MQTNHNDRFITCSHCDQIIQPYISPVTETVTDAQLRSILANILRLNQSTPSLPPDTTPQIDKASTTASPLPQKLGESEIGNVEAEVALEVREG